MNHNIEAYLDGSLDAEAHAAFEKQLAGDPALRQAVEAARQLRLGNALCRGRRGGCWRETRIRSKSLRALRKRRCAPSLGIALLELRVRDFGFGLLEKPRAGRSDARGSGFCLVEET